MTLDTLKRAKVGETVEIPLYDSVNATRWVLKPKKVSVLLFENFLGLFGTGKLLNLFPKNCTLLTASRKLIALPKNRTQQSWAWILWALVQCIQHILLYYSNRHTGWWYWCGLISQVTIPCLQKYITIELKLIAPKPDTKTPKKPAGGKMGNVYPRPRQWCHPRGVGYHTHSSRWQLLNMEVYK